MKFICLKENISQAIRDVVHIIGRSSSLPILSNILIETEEARVRLAATNLEIAVQSWFPAKILSQGSLTLPAQLISQLIQNFPDEKITIEGKSLTATVFSQNHTLSVKGLSTDDFPPIPKIDDKQGFIVGREDLINGLESVAPMVAQTENRPEFHGIFIHINDKIATLVSTDSYRLARTQIPVRRQNNEKEELSIIFPIHSAHEAVRLFSQSPEDISVSLTQNQILFKTEQRNLLSMLIDAKYPNYESVIPSQTTTTIYISREKFIESIKLAGIFSTRIKDIYFASDGKKKEIEIRARDPERGEQKSVIEADVSGEPVAAAFNYQYLLDGLQFIKSKRTKLEFNGSTNATRITAEGNSSYLYVIMPIRNIGGQP